MGIKAIAQQYSHRKLGKLLLATGCSPVSMLFHFMPSIGVKGAHAVAHVIAENIEKTNFLEMLGIDSYDKLFDDFDKNIDRLISEAKQRFPSQVNTWQIVERLGQTDNVIKWVFVDCRCNPQRMAEDTLAYHESQGRKITGEAREEFIEQFEEQFTEIANKFAQELFNATTEADVVKAMTAIDTMEPAGQSPETEKMLLFLGYGQPVQKPATKGLLEAPKKRLTGKKAKVA